jgi:hypothetical protein
MGKYVKYLRQSDGQKLGEPKPFYSLPLSDLASRCSMMASALRTLSDAQLATEAESLRRREERSIAIEAMIHLYDAEKNRRSALVVPVSNRDDELSAALSRLESKTTAEDRNLVRQIGETLHRGGGVPETLAAMARMTEGFSERRAGLRAYILQQRWAGLL